APPRFPCLRAHRPKSLLRHEECALQVDIERAVPICFRERFHPSPDADARIVHEKIGSAPARLALRDPSRDVGGAGDIRYRGEEALSPGTRITGSFRELMFCGADRRLAATADRDLPSRIEESAGDREADAARSAGDPRDPGVEFHSV